MEDIAILIPTLNPDIKLINLVKELKNIHLDKIVIIDDGQHTPKDIKKVALKLKTKRKIILGIRDFNNKNMPLTSKIGNTFSSLYYQITTGQNLTDTQNGLRGIPNQYFSLALNIPGQRYEYETRFLEAMYNNNIQYLTVNITTVYGENWTTHFRFINDSYIIYQKFFRNILSSLSSAIIDILLFMLLVNLIDSKNAIIVSTTIARLISGIYNFTLNKIWTFEKKDSHNTQVELVRYIILFTTQMFVSGIATELLNTIFGTSQFGLLIIKIIVDLFIFITNFIIQKNWVFRKNSPKKIFYE